MNASLSLRDVSVKMGPKTLVDGAAVDLHPGEVTVVIGPNGAGKSTLLSVAAGQLRPSSGTVLLGDREVHRFQAAEAARRRVMMPQDSSVSFAFTVEEIVSMGRTPWRKQRADDRAAVAGALRMTGLSHLAGREVTTLSGGERQRTALARTIAQATPVTAGSVVLLDEPTSAMDVAHAEATLALMRDLAAQGAAVCTVLHDLDAAASYADRLVLMERGRIRAQGRFEEVCRPELLSEVYGTAVEVLDAGGRLRVGPARSARTG
ncbi:heme ABC transporter ATP-binding protein [Arthrobacter sp. NPDC090010]|uniref:heme ABC transporter ATP-binding protein n=1 Tax=Arthrobacter sp. NPDC090010 TaxID=3363942 RepID=UPI003827630A